MVLAQSRLRFNIWSPSGPVWPYLLLFIWLCPVATIRPQDDDVNKAQIAEALRNIGQWVWDKKTSDKQTVRFWHSFVVPRDPPVSSAVIYITVDDSYRLLLDGSEIGRGSDWKTITRYDIKGLLRPGEHVLVVEAFNDRLAAGLMFGMEIQFPGEPPLKIASDSSWKIIPSQVKSWETARRASASWNSAVIRGKINQAPWKPQWPWPYAVFSMPPLQPPVLHFWQELWFQITLLCLLGLAVLACLWLITRVAAQTKAQELLRLERVRIARDLHDDLSTQVTQLVLQGEIAQGEQPADSPARLQFKQICEQGRELARAMGEVVWAVNSRRDTVRDFVAYVCKYAGSFLGDASIRCRLDIEPEIPAIAFNLPTRRNLFLAVKEALNNAARHSRADELFLRIHRSEHKLIVVVEDHGRGFDPAQADAGGNGLSNMVQRLREIGGACEVVSQPGGGCQVIFSVPLERPRRRWGLKWFGSQKQQRLASAVPEACQPASLK